MGKLLRVVSVKLVCHHYATAVDLDDGWLRAIYCPQCSQPRRIKEVTKWGRAKCLTCIWAYKGRVDRAERMAYGHADRYQTHVVQCYEGKRLLFTTTLKRAQPELPLFQAQEQLPPPF